MTDQELIAKQAAIIQAQEIQIDKLIQGNLDIDNLRVDAEIDKLRLKKEITELNNIIESYKIKKRQKFIMIINRKKRK